MDIFWRMLLAHLLADFTLQSNSIAAWKRASVWGMAVHTAMHPALSIALTWPYLGQTWAHVGGWALNGWTCVFLNYATHFLQDQWRVAAIARRPSLDNLLFFAWDQLVHVAVIYAVVPISWGAPGPRWPPILVLFAVATHFTTVLVYFLDKDFWGGRYPGDVEKYLGIVERGAVVAAFLLPGFWWLGVAVAFGAVRAWLKRRGALDFDWKTFSLGAAMALGCGALARTVYFS